MADPDARARLERWRGGFERSLRSESSNTALSPRDEATGFPGGGNGFAARLAEVGIDEAGLLGLLAERPEHLAARISRPVWVDVVERAVRAAAPMPAGVAGPDDWREAFAIPLRPLVAGAAERLVEQARRILSGHDAELPAIADSFTAQLGKHLVAIAARAIVLELNRSRRMEKLAGAGTRERFTDFIARLAEPAGLAALFSTYPVLARLLGQTCEHATDSTLELLVRFTVDRAAIVATLLDGTDPGPIVAIEAGQGDRHQGGRSVAILTFADQRRVVYKPRDLASHERLSALVSRLNQALPELELRTANVVTGAGYGWMEFIAGQPMAAGGDADRFYRRQGALLALLHAVHASDVHCENLIACGDQPVLVDAETLFHPTLAVPGTYADPAAAALAASVHRTSLLPFVVVGENGALDMSGLGGDRGRTAPANVVDWEFPATDRMRLTRRATVFGGAANRPRLGERDIDPGDHETALLEGFRLGYDAITRHREDFRELIEECADLEVRVVVRPTQGYQTLLDESTHPDVLRDALERDRVFDLLWTESVDNLLRWQVSRYESADLWAGDVPLFTGRPGTRDLWTSGGQRLADRLDATELHCALRSLDAMGEVDRRDQEWIISATLATRGDPGGHRAAPMSGPVAGTAAQPERLLAVACGIADRLVARSLAGGNRVNWLGLELVDESQWLVLPMGAGLANGYVGVALFLAQLANLSGITRYAEVARSALAGIPPLFGPLAARPDLVATIGCGGYHGLGGIAYALARMSVLLGDSEVRQWAEQAVGLCAVAAGAPGPLGWASGHAGCLAAMTAVHAELGFQDAARLAMHCADTLIARPDRALPPGFADGAEGIGAALRLLPGHTYAAGALLAGTMYENEPGFCSGAAGQVAARFGRRGSAVSGLERAVRVLADRPVLGDLSLCHGEMGVADALTVLGTAHRLPVTVSARRRRAGLVLDAIDQYGPRCGTPRAVATPGLLSGLAGIGYGLLRLGFAERVPSVLLLEPGIDENQHGKRMR